MSIAQIKACLQIFQLWRVLKQNVWWEEPVPINAGKDSAAPPCSDGVAQLKADASATSVI